MSQGQRNRVSRPAAATVAAGFLLLGLLGMSPKPTGESLADLRAKARKTVADPARATEALSALDSISALIPYVAEIQSRTSNDLRTTTRGYRSTKADFEAVIARWEADRAQLRTRALAAHERFKLAVTDDEWKKLRSDERAILFQFPIVSVPAIETAPKGNR
jgi:hypothetical protein